MCAVDPEALGEEPRPSSHPLRLMGQSHRPQQHPIRPSGSMGHHIHAMVDAITDIHIEATWLTKERFVAWGAATVAVAGGVVLGIRLRFHDHAPQQGAVCLAFHQLAANQLRGNDLRWTAEEGVRQGWEVLGDGLNCDGDRTKAATCKTNEGSPKQPAFNAATDPSEKATGDNKA